VSGAAVPARRNLPLPDHLRTGPAPPAPSGANKEPSWRALTGVKCRGPTGQVRATLALDVERMARGLEERLHEGSMRLILEPGRARVGNAGALITRVLYCRLAPSRFSPLRLRTPDFRLRTSALGPCFLPLAARHLSLSSISSSWLIGIGAALLYGA
jgi:hypothetical protein